MLISPDKLADVLKAYQATQELLNELETLGFTYKRLACFDFEPGTGYPRWRGIGEGHGIIHFPDTADARSVAHEMGHGFYECLKRDYDLPDRFSQQQSGEAFAEAIRWFLEERLGEREWEPQYTVVLEACERDFSRFKAMLQGFARKHR
jgi:hypothetical protein